MESIIVHAPAKINLSLRVLGKRADGYHLLESHVVFAEYGDVVEVRAADDLSLEIVGEFAHSLACEPLEKNLAWKAALALRDCFLNHPSPSDRHPALDAGSRDKPTDRTCNSRPRVKHGVTSNCNLGINDVFGAHITLTKNLPIGSGIGGGSADAAAALRALVGLWNIKISEEELSKIGLSLGADVPVCLYGKPAIMRGVGEDITPADLPAQKYIVLLNPLISLSTKEIFSSLREGIADEAIQKKKVGLLPATPSVRSRNDETCTNHLQPAAIIKLPIIEELLNSLKSTKNCKFAQMSGSGATCFGLYESEQDAKNAANQLKEIYREMWCISTKIKE